LVSPFLGDYSGITSGIDDVAGGIGDIGDSAEKAGGAAKKLKPTSWALTN
jgi:hypothetical protein